MVHGIREVRIGIGIERQAEVLDFYCEVLGLALWSRRQQVPGGVGLGDVQRGVLLQYRHDPPVDPLRRRLTVIVASLREVCRRLREREWSFTTQRGFGVSDEVVHVSDPVGHRLELRELRGF